MNTTNTDLGDITASITYGVVAPGTISNGSVRVTLATGEAEVVAAHINAGAWVGRRFPTLAAALAELGEESPDKVEPEAFVAPSERYAIAYELRRLGATVEPVTDEDGHSNHFHLVVNGRRVSTCGVRLYSARDLLDD
jgi:hypothetical protein